MQNGRAEGTEFRRDETTFSRADIELHNNLAGSRIAEQLVNWLVALMQENSLQIGFWPEELRTEGTQECKELVENEDYNTVSMSTFQWGLI